MYRHVLTGLESVIENKHCNILRDFPSNTRRAIWHHRPDVMVIYKEERECLITDFPFPQAKTCSHEGIQHTEEKQISKTCSFINIQKLLNVNVAVVPMVVGALWTVSTELEKPLKKNWNCPMLTDGSIIIKASVWLRTLWKLKNANMWFPMFSWEQIFHK